MNERNLNLPDRFAPVGRGGRTAAAALLLFCLLGLSFCEGWHWREYEGRRSFALGFQAGYDHIKSPTELGMQLANKGYDTGRDGHNGNFSRDFMLAWQRAYCDQAFAETSDPNYFRQKQFLLKK
jgi:hypothetical protein